MSVSVLEDEKEKLANLELLPEMPHVDSAPDERIQAAVPLAYHPHLYRPAGQLPRIRNRLALLPW